MTTWLIGTVAALALGLVSTGAVIVTLALKLVRRADQASKAVRQCSQLKRSHDVVVRELETNAADYLDHRERADAQQHAMQEHLDDLLEDLALCSAPGAARDRLAQRLRDLARGADDQDRQDAAPLSDATTAEASSQRGPAHT